MIIKIILILQLFQTYTKSDIFLVSQYIYFLNSSQLTQKKKKVISFWRFPWYYVYKR